MAAFAPGDLALLLDPEGKRYLVRLAEADTLHHHLGMVRHADVIGQPEGTLVRSSQGRPFAAVRPRLVDYVFEMPRRSGIVYPKDAAHIVSWADIGPEMRVLEAGVGSGALTLALLRAVGNLLLRERDIYSGIVDAELDRIVLDLAEPWRVLPFVPGSLKPGGWVCAYTPSIVQASQVVEAAREARQYVQIETHEVLLRGWHLSGQAMRPQQQMVGHTGFITVARLVFDTLRPQ
jgi:tRNA (adenine57-N1/adenine58-N1)-methyltransferase